MTFETLEKANELKRKIDCLENHLREINKFQHSDTYIGDEELIPIHIPERFIAEYKQSVQSEIDNLKGYFKIL